MMKLQRVPSVLRSWLASRRSFALLLALAIAVPVVALASQWSRASKEAQLFAAMPGTPVSRDLMQYAAARARPVFAANCASCHGADMKGNQSIGVPDLTDRVWIYGTGQPDEIEQTILYGIRSGHHRAHDLADMPAYGRPRPYRRYPLPSFSSSQIADLADYVRVIGGHAADPVAAQRGHALFYGSGQCYDCHTSDASGDNFAGAPSLVGKIWLYGGSRATIINTITGGRAGSCPAWAGRLNAGDIRAIAIYISSMSQQAKPSETHAAG